MDEARMLQVFSNLIENAIQHSKRGGNVTLAARVVESHGGRAVECTVADEGAGFAPGDLTRAFEPFFSRRRGGTGLGLSIVQRIVEQHGGSIIAANRPTGGAVVAVKLPAAL
jgi:signal transduction histidine kinase